MSIGYNRAVLQKMMNDPSYSYEMNFKDFIRMYKSYSGEPYDSVKSIITFGGGRSSKAKQNADMPNLSDVSAFGQEPASSSSSGGSAAGELLEQSDIDALLAQMQ